VAGRVFYANFFSTVESGALGEIHFGALYGGFDGFEIFDLEIEEGRAFANVRGDGRVVAVDAGIGLVHDFGGTAFESYEAKLIAFGDFDGFCETEFIDPEREKGFDAFDEEDSSDFLDHEEFSLLNGDEPTRKAKKMAVENSAKPG
jgi:hypothetical protein